MRSFILITFSLLSWQLIASPLEVDHISVETWKTLTRRDPYQYELTDHWVKGAGFNFNLRIFDYISWKNFLHMDGTASQLKNAGWQFDLSFDRYPIQPFYGHHSQHSLDFEGARDPDVRASNFPLVDKVGIRLVFYEKHN